MARQKAEVTKVQVAAKAAKEAHAKAKEAHEKQNNANTKKALDAATEAMKIAVKAENRERFLKVGKNRTIKARSAIRQLIKVANKKTYEYSEDEANKILTGLREAFGDVQKAFSTTTATGEKAGDSFSF